MTNYNIIKQKKLKIHNLKNEYKFIIIKSILHNRDIKPIMYGFLKHRLTLWSTQTRISFQRRVCLILSKHRSVHPRLNLKRHTIKKLNATADIPNLTISKW
jgi:hypothetical protein